MTTNKSPNGNALYSAALVAVIVAVVVFICLAVYIVLKSGGLTLPITPTHQPVDNPTTVTTSQSSTYSKDLSSIIDLFKQGDPPSMKVAYSYESGPYTFERNGAEGLEMDIIHEFEQRWFKGKSKFDFQGIGVDDRINIANTGDFDFVVGAISRNDPRCIPDGIKNKTICTDTVHMRDKAYVMINSKEPIKTFDSLNQFCDFFNGRKVGFLKSTISLEDTNVENQNYIKLYDCPENVDILPKDSRLRVVGDVVDGFIAGYITDGAILRYYANEFPEQTKVVDFSNVISNSKTEEYTFLLPENHLGLRQLMDKTLQAMICDGTLEDIYKKYSQYIEPSFSTPPSIGQQTCNDLQNDSDIYPFISK